MMAYTTPNTLKKISSVPSGIRHHDACVSRPLYPHELSDAALQWCGRELERSFRGRRLSLLEAGRLFVRCEARSLPATRLDGREIVPALLATQRADGSFGSGDSEARSRVDDTLEAILVLLRPELLHFVSEIRSGRSLGHPDEAAREALRFALEIADTIQKSQRETLAASG